MKKGMKIAAVSVAAVMAAGIFAGCDLVSTNPFKDYEQVIAEVDISQNEDFKTGDLKEYAGVITKSEITKRDMVESFAANGSNVMNSYGWTYKDTFDAICNSLVNRELYVQYAKVYCLKNENGNEAWKSFSAEGYKSAVEGKKGIDAELAGLEYFLDEDEANKAVYDLRVSFNSSLDSLEEDIIDEEDEDDEHDETVRTTPTGVNTENEDYFDANYGVYTGTQIDNELGGYEKVTGSTASTRRKAYAQFLTSLRRNGLLTAGEDTSSLENLTYYKSQLKSAYESALITKIADDMEETAKKAINADYLTKALSDLYDNQKSGFAADKLSMDDALDGMSDSSFVVTSPEAGYGFVINILLPFSASQSQKLSSATMDTGDPKGNKFATRASLLKDIKATDQRGTWFTGHDDYSFKIDSPDSAYVGDPADSSRCYLFFEDSLNGGEDQQYEALKNYYGKYTYNGTVTVKEELEDHTHYTLKPNKITIDDFIKEMEGYLGSTGVVSASGAYANGVEEYFTRAYGDYYKEDGNVNYDAFVYYKGSVDFKKEFDPSQMFVYGSNSLENTASPENTAFSVINELSFAYNTDTAGLNTYLGYAVTPHKTSFVSEFEYAAHEVCKEGAGSYMIVPSDYGWHFLYCTFSFTEADTQVFTYSDADKDVEGSFSNLWYEAMKAQAANNYASNFQTEIINKYVKAAATIYEDRYADLSNLDNMS